MFSARARLRTWCSSPSGLPNMMKFVNQITSIPAQRSLAISAASVLVFVLAVYAALLSIGHLGVDVPVLSALGPGGDRVILVAGISFAVGAVIYTIIGVGLLRLRRWAWVAGVAVSALSVLSGIGQFRGAGSMIGIVLSLIVLVLLLTPQARTMLHR